MAIPILTFLAALGSGLIAGVFFAFSSFVMGALGRLPAGQSVAAMQSINVAVLNRSFLGVFVGTALACGVLAFLSVLRWHEPGALLRLVAALAYLLGIAVCAVGAYLLWNQGVSLALVFALFFAYQNVQLLMMLWRTEPSSSAPPELLEAEVLFRDGKLAEARRRIEALSGRELPRSVLSRLHHLLGWIALREGEGRRALDHFSQVQGRPVERHALAAAFSLIGDEARALPLWEQAYQETHDPGILQEWAGALLRAGRTDDAERLPGVDLAGAYGAAERMAFLRGAYSEAVRFGEEGFRRRPTAEGAYDLACAQARAGDTRRAVDSLERARELGYTDVEGAATDPDLASLQGMSSFDAWLNSLRKSASP